MGKYFGTDGFRGEANRTLTVQHAFEIGRFIGWYFGKEHKCKVVIGKDTRRSCYMFEDALSAGLTASGADVYLLHVTTTPSVSYAVQTEDFDCGIMITASHNPYTDNGIKLVNSRGEKMEQDVLDKIEAHLDGLLPPIPLATCEKIGRTIDYIAGRNRYVGYLISLAINSYKNIRVGLDCANGSTWTIAKSVFDALGAKTYVINNEPNGLNINVDSGSTHIEVLQQFVLDNGLDVGFAFDGDADRCLAVDKSGMVIDGDKILYIYGCYMKERGKLVNNTVVTTVMSNFGLYKAFDEKGIDYVKTDVGDAVGAAYLQRLQPVLDEILVCPPEYGVGGGLEGLEYGDADARYDRNGEEGHTALADTAQQMFKTCGFHHQTNSFAAAGCLFTMISATTPPFMRMTRLAILAISSLCVTMSMVVPALITSSSTVRTSMLVS